MKLWIRILCALIICVCLVTVALRTVNNGLWFALVFSLIGGWKISRDVYLSRWRLVMSDKTLSLSEKGHDMRKLRYEEIRRVWVIPPSLTSVVGLLWERQRKAHQVGEAIVRSAVPLGLESRHAWRRVWTLSSDVLLQCNAGQWLLLPLSSLDGVCRRDLWITLRLGVPQDVSANDFRPNQQLLQEACTQEGAGDRAWQNRQWCQAVPYLRGAAELWEKAGHMDSVARCLGRLAECQMRLGQFIDAAGHTRRAFELAENMGKRGLAAHALNLLAEKGLRLGDRRELEQALGYLKKALGKYDELGDVFMHCRMLSNMAIIEEELFVRTQELCHLDEAQRLAHATIPQLKMVAKDYPEYAVCMQEANLRGTLARCHFHRQEWTEAARLFDEANRMGEKVNRSTFPEDIALWGRALFRQGLAERPVSCGRALMNLSTAFYKLCQAVGLSRGSADFSECLHSYILRGDSFWELGNVEAATRDYEVVVSLMEGNRHLLEQVLERNDLMRQWRRIYDRLIEGLLGLAAHDEERGDELRDKAFRYCELSKAKALSEAMSVSHTIPEGTPDTLQREMDEAVRQLILARARVECTRNHELNDDLAVGGEIWRSLEEAEDTYRETRKRMSEGHPELMDEAWTHAPSYEQVRAWLPRDHHAGVLAFGIGESSLCVFFVTNSIASSPVCLRIPGFGRERLAGLFLQEGFLRSYEEYTTYRQNFVHRDPDEEETFKLRELQKKYIACLPQVLKRIREMLDTPDVAGQSVRQAVADSGIDRLVIIPDGLLHRLPLHAAIEQPEDITYAPSCAVLIEAIRGAGNSASTALVVANPAHAPGNYTSNLFEEEGEIVTDLLLQAGYSVSRLGGEQAGVEAIMNGLAGCSLFHFAGHGESNLRDPMDSHLKIAGYRARLTTRDLTGRGIMRPGAWVVVDACETGVAPVDPSGEYIGLPAAFLLAGASVVVSSLWEVDEATPLLLMRHFYNGVLGDGLSPGRALSHAVKRLRALSTSGVEKELSGCVRSARDVAVQYFGSQGCPAEHPFHWAPFIVCGAGWTCKQVGEVTKGPMGTRPLLAEVKLGECPFELTLEVIRKADEHISSKQYTEAIQIMEQAREKAGPSIGLHDRLGDCYAEVGDFEKAHWHYRQLLDSDVNNFLTHYNLGCLLRDSGNITEARVHLQKALSLNPGHVNSMVNLAELTNNSEEAVRYLQQAAAAQPTDADINKAVDMWSKLSNLSSEELIAHRLFWAAQASEAKDLQHARIQLGLAKEGEHLLDQRGKARLLAIESDILRAENAIGNSLKALEKAVLLDPTVAFYWNNLAARRLLKSEALTPEQAKPELERATTNGQKAIDMKGQQYARPCQNLAYVHMRLWELTGDRIHLQTAKRLAQQALEMANQQLRAAPLGPLICKGCSTQGKSHDACHACIEKAKGLLRDIDLASGDYSVG